MTSETQTTKVTVHPTFAELPGSAEALFVAAQSHEFFSGLAWYRTLEACALPPGARLCIYVAWQDASAEAALVTCAPGSLDGSRIRPALERSNSLSGAHNFQSCVFGPVVREGLADCRLPLASICRFIAAERPAWDCLELNALDRDAPTFDALCEGLRQAGFRMRPYPHFGSWYDRFEHASYRDYAKSRGGSEYKVVQNYERKERKLKQAGDVRLVVHRGPDEFDAALAAYETVVASSWKGTERFPALTPGLLREAAKCDALRMGMLYLDGKPIATEVGVVASGVATMVKTAYAEAHRDLSPGAIVVLNTLNVLLAEGVHEINFGRDDQDYKRLWLARRRERWGIAAYNPRTVRGLLWWLVHEARNALDRLRTAIKPLVLPLRDALRRRAARPRQAPTPPPGA